MPMSKNKQIGGSLVRALSVLCVALGAVSVAAGGTAAEGPQQGSPQGPADSSTTLEEVVVTAETYKSTAQSTPISMSALSGGQLESSGITSLEQVARDVPGLSMRSSGPNQTEF
jgi:iron complex outermembrane recepter protein